MGKFNLSEAAKEILAGSVAAKKSGQESGVGNTSLKGDVAYGTQQKDLGSDPTKTTDTIPDYCDGVPSSTPPGATPPVGSEPMKKLSAQPGQSGYIEQPEGKPAKQTMAKNPGATFQSYGEEAEVDGDLVEEEKEEGHEDEAQDKALIKKMMKKEKMKEDMDALLSGENLSEEFKSKAATIFEAAVLARADAIVEEVEAQLTEQFEIAVEQVKEEMAAKVDDYLNYMVEEWVKDNEIAIEKGLRAEVAEDFMNGLRDLFIEHYIDIPEEKVDIAEELSARVDELESALNEQINKGVELTKSLNEQKKIEAIYTACEGLTQTQVEKLKSLAENVEFTTEEEFVAKVDVLKESYFKAEVKVANSSALDDEVQIEEEVKKSISADPSMEVYAKAISQTLIK
jgi:hypothetical protein